MSSALLAKLKIKNRPNKNIPVSVNIPKPTSMSDIKLTTLIVDKTKTSKLDRTEFMKLIMQPTKPVEKKPDIAVVIPKPVMVVKKLKKKLKLVDAFAKEQVETAPVETAPVQPAPVQPTDLGKLKIRKTKQPIGVVQEGPESMLVINDIPIDSRITKDKKTLIKASSYYMNNRAIFINFMSSLFGPYKKELLESSATASCERDDNDNIFVPMAHQKIVRDYINLYTPYRGILLYHGLGSGKTCSSIAIAEGMKTDKQIIVMTPASLRTNYYEELKICGDSIYRKNQFWEFISTIENPEYINTLSSVLSLSVEFISKQGGAWLVNMTKASNFETLDTSNKESLDKQLNEMIKYKYKFIAYNGLRKSHLRAMTSNYTKNPFDNAVIIIDEAHNFVSRIVNKLNKKDTLSGKLYEYLMNSQNTNIVLLTGTPIINYPNEIAIMFNILRGKIKTWYFKLTIKQDIKISNDFFAETFKSTILGGNVLDYMEYNPTSTTLVVTRNPFGFVNKTRKGKYDGVHVGERGDMSDDDFVGHITRVLSKNGITVNTGGIRVEHYKALPDKLDDFKTYFIDSANEVKNMNLFKKRILGLASYFRSAQESLMPAYEKSKNFHVVKIPMSDFQFGIYEEARTQERKLEMQSAKKKKKAKDDLYEDSVSTYRIFSRAFCNFVFPRPDIKRPLPGSGADDDLETAILKTNTTEDIIDSTTIQEKIDNIDGLYEADEVIDETEDKSKQTYDARIKDALSQLNTNKTKYLSKEGLELYSPKFLNILENIQDEAHKGLHLIYSQFRTLEGIGILKLVLEANGFTQFKLKQVNNNWTIDIAPENKGKPTFALYTGTETPEEKEIIRNIFNGTWKYIPLSLADELRRISSNNMLGEIIKILMITASGAEGISLRNVRYVHITEPYWHPVRTEQVIGRARRICSHQDLPEELRTVDVFLYLMTFSKTQLNSDASIELRLKDKSKIDSLTPITSDEALYEIATLKEEVTNKILQAVKESSIDCSLHSHVGSKEQLQCFSFGTVDSSKYSFQPSLDSEEVDTVAQYNKQEIKWKGVEVTIEGVKYALNKKTGDVYDLDSYNRKQPVQIGKLIITGTGKSATYKFERL
jgi:hypothetical protein